MSKSATYWIESDPRGTLSTHASFQITGDALVPGRLSEIIGIEPTTAHAKDESYSAGARTDTVLGRTGVWLISTRAHFSNALDDHLAFLIARLFRNIHSALEVAAFIERWHLKAEIHLFWHGQAAASWPEPTANLLRLSNFLSAPLIRDMNREHADAGDQAADWPEDGRLPAVGAA